MGKESTFLLKTLSHSLKIFHEAKFEFPTKTLIFENNPIHILDSSVGIYYVYLFKIFIIYV